MGYDIIMLEQNYFRKTGTSISAHPDAVLYGKAGFIIISHITMVQVRNGVIFDARKKKELECLI